MRSKVPAAAWILGAASTAPFWVLALLFGFGDAAARSVHGQTLIVYASAVAAFMGGSRWGVELGRDRPRWRVLTPAVGAPLAALVLAVLDLPVGAEALALIAVFLALWLWDALSADLPRWYPRLRTAVTLAACAGLALVVESAYGG